MTSSRTLEVPVRAPRRGGYAWRYFGEMRSTLLAPQLLLLQVAHPAVGAGVYDHSDFRADPWKRLWRTLTSLGIVIYGGQEAATAEGRRLREVHADMKGLDSSGRRYHALHPEAYHWVHATLVRAPVQAQSVFGPGMTAQECELYYQEMRGVGRVWGIKPQHLPEDWDSFVEYYDDMVENRLELNRSVEDVMAELSEPSKPFRWLPTVLWWPLAALAARYVRLVTVGTLPEGLRSRLELPWSRRDERSLRRFAGLVRALSVLVPRPWRIGGSLAIAYWATHKPGTDPRERRPLGTP